VSRGDALSIQVAFTRTTLGATLLFSRPKRAALPGIGFCPPTTAPRISRNFNQSIINVVAENQIKKYPQPRDGKERARRTKR